MRLVVVFRLGSRFGTRVAPGAPSPSSPVGSAPRARLCLPLRELRLQHLRLLGDGHCGGTPRRRTKPSPSFGFFRFSYFSSSSSSSRFSFFSPSPSPPRAAPFAPRETPRGAPPRRSAAARARPHGADFAEGAVRSEDARRALRRRDILRVNPDAQKVVRAVAPVAHHVPPAPPRWKLLNARTCRARCPSCSRCPAQLLGVWPEPLVRVEGEAPDVPRARGHPDVLVQVAVVVEVAQLGFIQVRLGELLTRVQTRRDACQRAVVRFLFAVAAGRRVETGGLPDRELDPPLLRSLSRRTPARGGRRLRPGTRSPSGGPATSASSGTNHCREYIFRHPPRERRPLRSRPRPRGPSAVRRRSRAPRLSCRSPRSTACTRARG